MITVVRAEENHIRDICELWLEFIYFHQAIDPVFTPRESAVDGLEEEVVRRLMDSEDGLVLVALDGDNAVGFSTSEIRSMKGLELDKYGAIDMVAVTAEYRRKGVGEQILEENLKWFKSRNITRVELEVAVGNQVGYPFWKKHGFAAYRHRLFRNI